ncbi:MAG: phosphotransferase [Pseudomonadota bacterium]
MLNPQDPLAPLDRLAAEALSLWSETKDGRLTRINVSENVTYRVDQPDARYILRLHRQGYHSRRAVTCELAWAAALRAEAHVATPAALAGRDGELIQQVSVAGEAEPRMLVLFTHIDGIHPDESANLTPRFLDLGRIAAQTHLHSIAWTRPAPFERLTWDLSSVFGPAPIWGHWRDGPNVTTQIHQVLGRVEQVVTRRLSAFGRAPDRFGLIHSDMRLANLLISPDGIHVLDFDDCGFGWFLYDFAAGISFIEDHPQIPALKAAWVEGYRSQRPLPDEDVAEIDTLIMLRRLALLGWIGSHIEAPEPQALAHDFARVSAELGEGYLMRMDGPR